ncbi:MAG: helix-turn-helix domain-containing protein [Oscillospiraceae bacterium]|nr:helix-turn-helix domain-containing protein [Oscillospiraceae bacterium]
MIREFGARLAAARKSAGLNQTEVARLMTEAGYPVRTQAVSKWERETTLPSAVQLIELCRLYAIRDVAAYFGLAPEELRTPGRILPLYRLAVSAGTGEFLDGSDYDTVEVGEEVSPQADFGVRIAGDSMEPRFVNGQIVWVHRQDTLRPGEIGVFLYNGSGYCKRLERRNGATELVSLNPLYAPIRVREEDEFRLFGKVVG